MNTSEKLKNTKTKKQIGSAYKKGDKCKADKRRFSASKLSG